MRIIDENEATDLNEQAKRLYKDGDFKAEAFRTFLYKRDEHYEERWSGLSYPSITGKLRSGGKGFAFKGRVEDSIFFNLLEEYMRGVVEDTSSLKIFRELDNGYYFSYLTQHNFPEQSAELKRKFRGHYVCYEPSILHKGKILLSVVRVFQDYRDVLHTHTPIILPQDDKRLYTGHIWIRDTKKCTWIDWDHENNGKRETQLTIIAHEYGSVLNMHGIVIGFSEQSAYYKELFMYRLKDEYLAEVQGLVNCYDANSPPKGTLQELHKDGFRRVQDKLKTRD